MRVEFPDPRREGGKFGTPRLFFHARLLSTPHGITGEIVCALLAPAGHQNGCFSGSQSRQRSEISSEQHRTHGPRFYLSYVFSWQLMAYIHFNLGAALMSTSGTLVCVVSRGWGCGTIIVHGGHQAFHFDCGAC